MTGNYVRPLADTAANTGQTAQSALEIWERETFSLGLVNTLIYAAIVAAVTFVVIRLIQHFLAKKLSGNMRIFYRLIYVAIIVIAVFSVLMTIKPLNSLGTAILASSGIAAVVIGLAAQQTLGNVFSGISISASKPFEVGEYIEILDVNPPLMGIVKDIGLRHTTIIDATNKSIVIPNSVIDKNIVRALHNDEETTVCSFLDVGVSYDSDIDLALKLLSDIVGAHENCLDVRTAEEKAQGAPRVTVRVQELAESSIRLRAFVWTKDAGTSFPTLSDLRYEIKKAYDANGIEIPYPYRSIVIKNDEAK